MFRNLIAGAYKTTQRTAPTLKLLTPGATPQRNMGFLQMFKDFIGKRTFVGEDFEGNRYYLYTESKDRPPRRMVDYKEDVPDPAKLHMLWSGWLRYTRPYPPTPEEIIKYEQDKVVFAEKVRKLEEADAKLRLQEQLERKLSGDSPSNVSMMSAEQLMNSMAQREAQQQSQSPGHEQRTSNQIPDHNPDSKQGSSKS